MKRTEKENGKRKNHAIEKNFRKEKVRMKANAPTNKNQETRNHH